jgi:hypothetical protein
MEAATDLGTYRLRVGEARGEIPLLHILLLSPGTDPDSPSAQLLIFVLPPGHSIVLSAT